MPGSEFLYLAGIWNNFAVPEKGPIPEHFTIITTNANASVAFCHNRMPVILRENEIEEWLTTDNPEAFLKPNTTGIKSRIVERTTAQTTRFSV